VQCDSTLDVCLIGRIWISTWALGAVAAEAVRLKVVFCIKMRFISQGPNSS